MKGVKKKKMRVVSEKWEQQATETQLFTNTTVDEDNLVIGFKSDKSEIFFACRYWL